MMLLSQSSPATRRLAILLMSLLALLMAACAGGEADDTEAASGAQATEYPDWLDKVYPPPGSETSVTQALQVDHGAVAQDQQVRLKIDGTDVTAYANSTSPGLLEYDMDQERTPVELRPGEHTAEVELYRVTPSVSEGVESYDEDVHGVVDSFSWTFTVL